ncbi:MAG: septum formation protein Maf [Desulfuromonadaceae bacterium]|nr:septum formation protein Maf [Desulfuromonadaceae bacterium]
MAASLILASTSPYRRQLLRQLGLPFEAVAPDYEEQIDQQVSPELLVKHLATGKARSLAERFPQSLIIGADQVFVDPRGRILGKPGTLAAARRQLQQMAGKKHTFYTGVTLFDARNGRLQSDFVPFTVTLRALSSEQIARYVEREQPVDCAGAFKIEGLGIALMASMEGEDYTALIGLPLLRLTDMLLQFGVDPLSSCS